MKRGRKFVKKIDFEADMTRNKIFARMEKLYDQKKFIVTIHETYITKQNLITGKSFVERYDTPSYCSPASETYWSM